MFADVVAIRDVLLHPQQPKPREHGLKVIHVIRGGVSGVAAQVKAAGIYRAQIDHALMSPFQGSFDSCFNPFQGRCPWRLHFTPSA